MTREEQIAIASCAYGSRGSSIDFSVGAKWADFNPKSPWISVEDDLPCNHKEFLNAECQTKNVFILKCGGFSDVDYMLKIDGNGYGLNIKAPNFACQFPNCQKSKNKIIYYQ